MKAKSKKNFLMSKTLYVDTHSCNRKLWLKKNMPHIAQEVSLSDKINMEQGTKVGVIATKEYTQGVLVQDVNNVVAHKKTMELLMSGVEYIFEATFIVDGFLIVKVDILRKNENGTYSIIEVKSSNSVKKTHYIDVAFQKYVLELSGLTIESCYLKHMNKEYQRGTELDVVELFKVVDITSDISHHYSEVEERIAEKRKILAMKTEPKCEVGSFCKNPHKCPFYAHCHADINKDSVQKFSRLSKKKRAIFAEKKIKYIKDVTPSIEATLSVNKVPLSFRQDIQRVAASNEGKVIINAERIKSFLDSKLVYPLFHLDFEATNTAIPHFKGARPNQFFVYQYSIDKEEENGKVTHDHYLHLKSTNPHRSIATKMLKRLEKTGSIVVWNQSFEAGRIRDMAREMPDLADDLLALIDRMVDIWDIFRNTWLYHHDMQGSASIKYVLPFLCPDLSYSRLTIANGSDSQAYYTMLMSGQITNKEKAQDVIKALLDYNNLDTWAMVCVLRRVQEMVAETLAE